MAWKAFLVMIGKGIYRGFGFKKAVCNTWFEYHGARARLLHFLRGEPIHAIWRGGGCRVCMGFMGFFFRGLELLGGLQFGGGLMGLEGGYDNGLRITGLALVYLISSAVSRGCGLEEGLQGLQGLEGSVGL